ncbi:MAG TPA: hypothetical protein VGH90_04855, partial [Chthoniobacteraceae bacterium]
MPLPPVSLTSAVSCRHGDFAFDSDFDPDVPGGTLVKVGRWGWHLALVILFAVGVTVLFLQEPGFGDDFTYWRFAFTLHERGLGAWLQLSFHDLRWPVWIICWIIQGLIGPGILSYYGEPIFYMAVGAALAFTFGRLITGSVAVAWAGAIAFLFHPLLDTVCYRPMPDLSEGVWGAASVLCWWMLMRAPSQLSSIVWAALTGLCICIGEANRIMGAFIVPVLILCTLLFARRRFGWLVVAGGFTIFFYGLESVFYHWLFKDWLQDVHANMGNAGHKGTESVALSKLPTRFLGSFYRAWSVTTAYSVFALLGIGATCLRRPAQSDGTSTISAHSSLGPTQLARVMAVWMVALYFEYSCSLQSIHPP